MKAKGVPKGLAEQSLVCGKCGAINQVRWLAIVTPYYTFSGYLCESCEPTVGPVEVGY